MLRITGCGLDSRGLGGVMGGGEEASASLTPRVSLSKTLCGKVTFKPTHVLPPPRLAEVPTCLGAHHCDGKRISLPTVYVAMRS